MNARPGEEGGSLVNQAVQSVRDHIRAHDLKVGDTLPSEGAFAAELGVSRAVMREAFGALAALRHIDVANGRRARVGAIDGSVIAASLDHAVTTDQISFFEIWDVRRTVEMRIAALAAEKRTDEQAERIVALAAAMADAVGDLELMSRHDIALHETIAQAAGNMLFRQIMRSFAPLMLDAVPRAWKTRDSEAKQAHMLRCHRDLATAILNHDVAGAVAAMDTHFDSAVSDLLSAKASGA